MTKRDEVRRAWRPRRAVRERSTYANVMATIAVFGVLAGGGAYAASKIGPNDIKKNAVRSKHIKTNQVKAKDLAPAEGFRSDGFLWPAYDPGWSEPGYYRDPFGRVYLKGMVKAGVNSRILELPAGYRPSASTNTLFMVPAGGDVLRRIDIDPDGVVRGTHTDPAQQAWLSLDGVSFRCAPSGSSGCP